MKGRPTDLTPAMQEKICDRFRTGASVRTTCESVGIGETTFHRWMARGERPSAALSEESSGTGLRARGVTARRR